MNLAKFVVASLVAAWLTVPAFAQEPSGPKGHGMKKAMHEEMQGEMKMMDERLDKLVTDMNTAATPEKRLEAVMAVINEMVAQHKKMHERAGQRWEEHHNHERGAGKTEETKKE